MKAQHFNQKLQKTAAGVIIVLALAGFEMLGRVFQAQPGSAAEAGPLANGIYLYGEDPQPDQIGKGYVVFSHQNGKVVGAFYYPRSEFDCFAGFLNQDVLDVKSVGADDSEVVEVKINLLDFHPIQTISGSDQQILSVCRQETARPFSGQLTQLFSSLLRLEKIRPSLDLLPV